MRGMVLGFLMQETESGKQIYQRDLEARFHTNRSSITTMLQGMEQDGFITRSAVAKDARLKRLVATEKGRACHKQIEESIARFEDDLQSGIDPQQAAAAALRWSRPLPTPVCSTLWCTTPQHSAEKRHLSQVKKISATFKQHICDMQFNVVAVALKKFGLL